MENSLSEFNRSINDDDENSQPLRDYLWTTFFDSFDSIPLTSFRKKWLAFAQRRPDVLRLPAFHSKAADWFEDRIKNLAQAKEDALAMKLFNLYLFVFPANSEETLRALDFGMRTLVIDHTGYNDEAARMIIGRLNKNPELYWQCYEIRSFIERHLKRVSLAETPTNVQMTYSYQEPCWAAFKRALELVMEVEDVFFLQLLEKIAADHHQGNLHPAHKVNDLSEDTSPSANFSKKEIMIRAANQSALDTAVKLLRKTKTQQAQGLGHSLWKHLKGLRGKPMLFGEEDFSSDLKINYGNELEFSLRIGRRNAQLVAWIKKELSQLSLFYKNDPDEQFQRVPSTSERYLVWKAIRKAGLSATSHNRIVIVFKTVSGMEIASQTFYFEKE